MTSHTPKATSRVPIWNRSSIRHNLRKTITDPFSMIIGLLVGGGLLTLGLAFLNPDLVRGNYGEMRLVREYTAQILNALCITLLVAATVHKIKNFTHFDHKKGFVGSIGGFFGVLVTGCPSCSITIASYVGLAGVLTHLPRGGVEIQILGIILVGAALLWTLRDLAICRLEKR